MLYFTALLVGMPLDVNTIREIEGGCTMPLGEIADILMYAPFVSVYAVPEEVHKRLRTDEFFGENGCYLIPILTKRSRRLWRK